MACSGMVMNKIAIMEKQRLGIYPHFPNRNHDFLVLKCFGTVVSTTALLFLTTIPLLPRPYCENLSDHKTFQETLVLQMQPRGVCVTSLHKNVAMEKKQWPEWRITPSCGLLAQMTSIKLTSRYCTVEKQALGCSFFNNHSPYLQKLTLKRGNALNQCNAEKLHDFWFPHFRCSKLAK